MRIDVKTKNVHDTNTIHDFVNQKLSNSIKRFASEVASIAVRVEDETRTSGRFDGICSMDATLTPGGTLHVSAHGDSWHDCILQAVRKLENALRHDRNRKRNANNIRHEMARSKDR